MRTAFLLALALGVLAPLPTPASAAPAARVAQDLPIPPGGRKATEAERKAVSGSMRGGGGIASTASRASSRARLFTRLPAPRASWTWASSCSATCAPNIMRNGPGSSRAKPT